MLKSNFVGAQFIILTNYGALSWLCTNLFLFAFGPKNQILVCKYGPQGALSLSKFIIHMWLPQMHKVQSHKKQIRVH